MIKEIIDYPGYYVDELGNIYSGKGKTLKLRRKVTQKNGYEYVLLMRDGKGYNLRVNRIVAKAFLPNPNNYPYVNHLNEIKNDNRVVNLSWCTPSENLKYGTARDKLNRLISLPDRPRRNNTSGRKGVSKKGKKWVVYFNGKYLGTFKTFEEAVKVREKAEKDLFD